MNEKTEVIGTTKSFEVHRFRRCPKCGKVFTTTESVNSGSEYLEEYKEIAKKVENKKEFKALKNISIALTNFKKQHRMIIKI